ncbi:MAG TPA: hypothetical protein VMO26_07180 [Vicinamibacterales bacterium]|nr:hypothetical protein [Vicinamibacterales bacterium]
MPRADRERQRPSDEWDSDIEPAHWNWNYAHNRNYLSYVQEQLGLPSEAIRGARELLAVPLDPRLNDSSRSGSRLPRRN